MRVFEASRLIKVNPNLNEQNEKDLFDAGKRFELIESPSQASRCRNEGHIEDDADEEDEKL